MSSSSSVYDELSPEDLDRARALGGRVRLARQRRKWTQQILSEKTGISVGTIKNMERGSPRVPLAFWLKAMDVFNAGHEVDTLLQPERDHIAAAMEVRQRVRTPASTPNDFEFPA